MNDENEIAAGDTEHHAVPEQLVQAGHDSDTAGNDSPENLDQELTNGADRERIDPHHSIDRPDVETIDKETLGAD